MTPEIETGISQAYKPHEKASARFDSVRSLIKLIVQNASSDVLPEHTRELLSILLWKATETDGKWNTRYRTRDSIACFDKRLLRHEHVYQRGKMIDHLLNADAEGINQILESAIGCVVTLEDHVRLAKFNHQYGWERYKSADIDVVDMTTMQSIF